MNDMTDDSSTRVKYLSSAVTLVVVLAYTGIWVLQTTGYATGTPDTGMWGLFSLAFIACIAYAVGVETIRSVYEIRNGTD